MLEERLQRAFQSTRAWMPRLVAVALQVARLSCYAEE